MDCTNNVFLIHSFRFYSYQSACETLAPLEINISYFQLNCFRNARASPCEKGNERLISVIHGKGDELFYLPGLCRPNPRHLADPRRSWMR